VSRIRQPVALEEASVRPAGFDLQRYWTESTAQFREKLPRFYATFLVDPSVLRWARYRGWRLEEESPEGDRIRVRLRFDAEDEALQFALSFGPALDVLDPPALRDSTARAAAATAAKYGAGSEAAHAAT
jgi:predicted DNA-binding transcriptional regulator YafY